MLVLGFGIMRAITCYRQRQSRVAEAPLVRGGILIANLLLGSLVRQAEGVHISDVHHAIGHGRAIRPEPTDPVILP